MTLENIDEIQVSRYFTENRKQPLMRMNSCTYVYAQCSTFQRKFKLEHCGSCKKTFFIPFIANNGLYSSLIIMEKRERNRVGVKGRSSVSSNFKCVH